MLAVCLPLGIRRINRRASSGKRACWTTGLVLAAAALLTACGGGSSGDQSSTGPSGGSSPSGTAAGTYTLAIVATSGATSHSVSYTLTVN